MTFTFLLFFAQILNPASTATENPDRELILAYELNSTLNEDFTDEMVDEVHYIGRSCQGGGFLDYMSLSCQGGGLFALNE